MSQIIQSSKIINDVELMTPKLIDPPPYAAIYRYPEKLNIVCVWWGDLYPIQYVETLRDSVERNITIPYDFYCITDRLVAPDGMIHIPCENQTGWWQKVNLFKPGLFEGRTLYLDLDVVITGSLDLIASSEGEMVMIENFGPNKGHAAYNSSCMLWTPSELTEKIYTSFDDSIMGILHGDQCWIWRVLRDNIKAFRKDLLDSYKYHKTGTWSRKTQDTSVWVFHGRPNPHEVNDDWVKRAWIRK